MLKNYRFLIENNPNLFLAADFNENHFNDNVNENRNTDDTNRTDVFHAESAKSAVFFEKHEHLEKRKYL